MIRKQDSFKLGAFIIVGTCLLVAIVIVLGAGRYFETSYSVESYFNESVNGLEIGSPVKLRGVRIGRVSDIDFVTNIYPQASEHDIRYVMVRCDINPDLFRDMSFEEFKKSIRKEEKQGLRVRPTSLGLTGQLFLNFVYVDPLSNPPLQVYWQPKEAYIPAIPSTLSRIEGAVTTISKTLKGIRQEDITSIISDVKSIVNTLDRFMRTKDGKKAGDRMLTILDQTRTLLSRTNELLASPDADHIIPHAASAMAGVDRIINESSDDLIAAGAEANKAMASFKHAADVLERTLSDPRMDKALSNAAPTLENITMASAELGAAVTKIHALVNRLNGVMAAEEPNIHAILQDTREVMQNIKELSGDAKRYPSGIFFGKPPSKSSPESK
ncbi:MlaD family protein [Pseudodesulfovibrio piezophilus]|uniref:Mammalian cell entry related domain protein n=1 Tax=Pseudodesulfovibrio piezophilus (strain DSM 21447 / JCM 15486 / C1TLV30) TaxID=1322246 RepID=M1WUC9_PSEP2|nr:MlaD family protein [Pseudodesulfovibrio piezophilus]CCH50567.1 Mammalian cell entry related domain protein [Pseudodesulfovibrio piezophilus C1TLV30]